jgi:hypothetical protein
MMMMVIRSIGTFGEMFGSHEFTIFFYRGEERVLSLRSDLLSK